jgi:hypothetical protein
MTTTYHVLIDRIDNGVLSLYGSDDVGADVLHIEWHTGMTDTYQAVAPPAEAVITLRNRDGAYSPEQTAIQPGQRLEIRSDDGSTVRKHFVGLVHFIDVDAGTQGQQQARVHARGLMQQLTEQSVRMQPRVTATAGTVLEDIFQQARFRYRGLNGFCVIDRETHNLIDSTLIFGDDTPPRSFQAGKTEFTYAGDIWRDDVPISTAIRHLTEADGGRFFVDRDGVYTFFDRHHLTQSTVRGTFSDNMNSLSYTYGSEILNRVDVEILPRNIGLPNTILWQLEEPVHIMRDSSLQIVASYVNSTGFPVGAVDVLRMEPYVHYRMTWVEDPTSPDATGRADVRFLEVGATATVIEILNRSSLGFWIQEMELRGTPISVDRPYNITRRDDLSITEYGVRRQFVSVPVLSDTVEAAALADTMLLHQRGARGRVRTLELSTHTQPVAVLDYSLFDLIQVDDSQTGHSALYHIIGQTHTIDRGGSRHRVRWLLEPSPVGQFVIINRSSINQDDLLLPR